MGKHMVTFAIIGTDCIGRCKSSLRMIMDVMNDISGVMVCMFVW